jgi:nucleoid DNA-binding protein
MIEEIKNPIEGMSFLRGKEKIVNKFLKKAGSIKYLPKYLNQYDVFIKTDLRLIDEVAKEAKISKKKAETYLVVFFEDIKRSLLDGFRVDIPGFGNFLIYNPCKNKSKKLQDRGEFEKSGSIKFSLNQTLKTEMLKYNEKHHLDIK